MFPTIALIIFINILVGQIPGCSVSGGLIHSTNSGEPSSSANEHYNPVQEVEQLLFQDSKDASRDYRKTIELAGDLFKQMGQRQTNEQEVTRELLYSIWNLNRLEEQLRPGAVIQCDSDVRWAVVETRKLINRASRRNEFFDEPAEHPLNKMINDLTDILFKACSIDINDRIEKLRFSVPEDEAENEVKLALINLDRFHKFLKLPKEPLPFDCKNIHFSFLSFNYALIDVNTKLEPEDLEFLGVPQDNTLSRNDLLQRLIERTCDRIEKDYSSMMLLFQGENYARDAYDIYIQTGKEYFFRSEIGYQTICYALKSLMLRS